MYKNSLKFLYDLDKESRKIIFDKSFINDPDNFAFLKLSMKQRTNKVDTNHSSRLLMENAIGNDQLYSARLGVKYNKALDYEYLCNTISMKASGEIVSNF